MDIKLRAKLSAYSKIESIKDLSSTVMPPVLHPDAEGHLLSVNAKGEYTLVPSITESDIDSLFQDVTQDTVTKDKIDELFPESETDTPQAPSFDTIDEELKNKIDNLFKD